MARSKLAVVAGVATACVCGLLGMGQASAASSSSQGVTATTIRVGIPYVDVAAVKAVGVSIDWGSVPDAFNAIISNMNAHGGINGRRIVPYIVAVNPTGTAPAATACTQLTEDDSVFVAIAPLMPDCYLQHGVPVIGAILQGASSPGVAQNFGLVPPNAAYDPLQLSVYAKQGVFKNKKVAIFAGAVNDQSEIPIVQSALQKLHVPVVTTAIDSAPQGDLPASNQQVTAIVQRFKSSGVNEVVAVGSGSAVWPQGLSATQSTYNPPWVATSESELTGDVSGDNNPTYLQNVVTSSPLTPPAAIWSDSGTQQCVHLVRKAYPSDHINAYSAALPASQATWMSVEIACSDMALLATIAKAAGKNLTVSSFVHAGYGLRNVVIPGSSAHISFAPGRPYALGPVYMVHYDPGTKALVFSTKSANQ
jgi:hypothetical protein